MSPVAADPSAFPPAFPPARGLTLDEALCFAVYAAGHAFNRVYKPLLDPLGLTYPQYLVMIALWTRDDRTVGDLGDALALESNTLTPLLKRMEAAGHLKRVRDAADERQVRVRLTPEGMALEDRAAGVPACVVAACGLDLATLADLRDGVDRLRRALESAAGR